MNLRAVMDKIIVKLLVVTEKTTEAGIVLTGDSVKNQEPQACGVVISKGDDVSFKVEVGDAILFHQRAGMDMILDGVVYKTLKDEEVYCVLENDEEEPVDEETD